MADITGIIPAPIKRRQRKAPQPTVAPAPRFLYFWRPSRFQVLKGHIIPIVKKMDIRPGQNSVDKDGDTALAIARMEDKGWVCIPEDIDGEGTSYLRCYRNAKSKLVYLDQHEALHAGSARISEAPEAHAQWLAELTARGVIAPVSDWVLAAMEDDLANQVDQMEQRQNRTETHALRLVSANLDVVREAMADRSEPVEPEPIEAVEPEPAKKAKK